MTHRISIPFPTTNHDNSPSGKRLSRNAGSVQIMQQANAIKVVGILFFLHTIKENANFVILNGFLLRKIFFKHRSRLTLKSYFVYDQVLDVILNATR